MDKDISCHTCRFWYKDGAGEICKRYPKHEFMAENDWCGEFKSKGIPESKPMPIMERPLLYPPEVEQPVSQPVVIEAEPPAIEPEPEVKEEEKPKAIPVKPKKAKKKGKK